MLPVPVHDAERVEVGHPSRYVHQAQVHGRLYKVNLSGSMSTLAITGRTYTLMVAFGTSLADLRVPLRFLNTCLRCWRLGQHDQAGDRSTELTMSRA